MTTEYPTPDEMYRADGPNESGPSGVQGIIAIDSDSDESDISSFIPSSNTLDGSDLTTRVKEFSERCLNGLPLNLMTTDFKEYLFYNSNQRFEEAKASGVDLDDIAIGDDCLPTWSGRTWDPDVESLHDIIQSRLATQDEARQAGELVREDIIWKTGGAAAEDAIRYLHHEDENDQHAPDDDEDCTLPVYDHETEQAHDTGGVALSQCTTLVSSDDSNSLTLNFSCFSDTDSDSNSDSESDPDIDSDDIGDFDDTFPGDNMFDPEPHYADLDEEALDIFHDARVVGVPSQYANVDLEIYEASDEDDVEDLPEMELCIDGELYEALFNTEEVVSVEIEGSRIICTGELFEEGEEIIVDDPEDDDAGSGPHEDEDGWDPEFSKENSGSSMFRQRVVTGDEVSNGLLSKPWEGPHGEQATHHAKPDDIFQETEDGFI
ncbi:hypothetical protein FSPOR_7100 [Fusarium sporotrichioides]|uniref:Uncharacterized protein n=1 Tax=Fusarium sporotrichioides TaxID=5514 RepID=A0A395S1C1_FUSSP|nr:hypothetical protein FSPOR_7100 [Fusarium sporotrichioides]